MNKFPSIEHFRQMFYELKQNIQYVGKDEQGISLYDPDINLPTLQFTGTVKLHGTNAGITYDVVKNKFYPQSKENIVTGRGHYGFVEYYENNKEFFHNVLQQYLPTDNNVEMITLFGEWCGKGIQKGVAVSKLDKTFFMFGIKVKYKNGKSVWLDYTNIPHNGSINFYNLHRIKYYEIEIDFNNVERYIDVITQLTMEVEEQCPVGTFFNVEGIGEGIVWVSQYNDKTYRFKSKGDKHKVSKSKTVSIEPEKQETIDDFINYTVTENRLQQGLDFIKNEKETLDVKQTGDFVKWVTNDIIKEESDVMIASNLSWNDIKSVVSKRCVKWFMGIIYKV